MTWPEVSRGVVRSPNHHLNQLGVNRKVEFGRRKVQPDRLLDVVTRFHQPTRSQQLRTQVEWKLSSSNCLGR